MWGSVGLGGARWGLEGLGAAKYGSFFKVVI
jgi:hypothetical protein